RSRAGRGARSEIAPLIALPCPAASEAELRRPDRGGRAAAPPAPRMPTSAPRPGRAQAVHGIAEHTRPGRPPRLALLLEGDPPARAERRHHRCDRAARKVDEHLTGSGERRAAAQRRSVERGAGLGCERYGRQAGPPPRKGRAAIRPVLTSTIMNRHELPMIHLESGDQEMP